MESTTSNFTGDVPGNYDRHLGPNIFHAHADDLVGRVDVEDGSTVLELAAGTGIVSRRLRDALPRGAGLIVSDLNGPMLDVARDKFSGGEAVTFEVIDALSLPFEEDTIDAIVCQFGVMFYPDKQQAYREALRVLKPGGVFLFNAWGSLDANPFARLAHEVGEDFFPDDAPTFYKVPFGYHAPETGLGELRIAGFSDVSAEIVAIDKQVVSWEDFSIGLVFGNPLAEEIRNRGGVEPETVRLAVAEALANHFGDAPTTMPLEAVVFTARKDH